jgi:hypothetical protein
VLILAILAWYCLVHKRKQSLSDRSVTIQNNMADDAAFKTPIQSPMQSPMQTPMQTPRGGGMMGVADEERGQLNQMKSFPDGLHNQPSMQSFAFQQPTMHTRTPTYSGQAASTVATIPQQPHYGLAQHQQPVRSAALRPLTATARSKLLRTNSGNETKLLTEHLLQSKIAQTT